MIAIFFAKVATFFATTKTLIIITAVGATALVVAVLASYAVTYNKGYNNGWNTCKVEWNKAELDAIERGRKSRLDAERGVTGGVPDDEFVRD